MLPLEYALCEQTVLFTKNPCISCMLSIYFFKRQTSKELKGKIFKEGRKSTMYNVIL